MKYLPLCLLASLSPLTTRLKSDLEYKQKTSLCPDLFFLTLGLKFVKPESDVKKKSLFIFL